jgi:dienelactone hydrolase
MKKLMYLLLPALVMAACSGPTKTTEETSTEAPKLESDYPGEEVIYENDGVKMRGFLSYDRGRRDQRPGILVVHEWWGHNDYVRMRAAQLADMGYVALAVDMYGDGKIADHPDDAGKYASAVFANMAEAQARFEKAIEVLKANPMVDPERIGAIGYCFGGTFLLNMANAGVDLKAIAVYHAGLNFAIEPGEDGIKAEILVCNGEDDQWITQESIDNFKSMMDRAGARYSFVNYEGAVHGFTNPQADELGKKFNLPLAYNEDADENSWKLTRKLFTRAFSFD